MDIDDYNIKDRISIINFDFQLEPDLKAAIHRDRGFFYKRKNLLKHALDDFTESLEHNPAGFPSLIERSKCKLDMGDVDDALDSIGACLEQYPDKLEAQQHRNNCIYEQNHFEKSLSKYSNTRNQFPTRRFVRDGPELVHMTIDGAVGTCVGDCLLNMRGDIEKYARYMREQQVDNRPLWKVLREKGECDVVSVLTKPQPYVPKMQQLRNRRKQSNMESLYVGSQTAGHIEFLKSLLTDGRLFLRQTQGSNALMKDTIEDGLLHIKRWENMLRCRKPIYAKRYTTNPDRVRRNTEDALNRIQERTRREVFQQLVQILHLAKNEPKRMLAVVEDVISNYYSIKTKRVFPRKFQFLNEIFNIVGISYLEHSIAIPSNLMMMGSDERLSVILQLPLEKKAEGQSASGIFGDRSTFVDPGLPDYAYFAYKNKVDELEKRLQRSSYPIERCYLCHELALLHMNQHKLDEPKILAVKLVDHAQACGNMVWLFLGHLTGARADMASGQLVGAGGRLTKMKELLPYFDEFVSHFVKTALLLHSGRMAVEKTS